jgi:catechol 2,3-dioxygenase-like lactoylglutathione lyase family enzyme
MLGWAGPGTVRDVEIREFFHLIHIVDDEDEVDAFYDELFAPQRFAPKHFAESEKRWASLSMVSDLMLEVIEPSGVEADSHMPLTRFRRRFGQHYHSLAWYMEVPDVRPLFDRLRAAGIRVAKPGGGMFPEGDIDPGNTIFTHPKDTFGQLEFEGKQAHWQRVDPRFQPGWTTEPWRRGPLGIERLSHMTTVVRDLEPARTFYEGVLGGTVFHEESSAQARRAFVLVGVDTVIELAQPTGEGSRLATDLAAHGELPHSATFRVSDLEAAENHVDKLGIGVAERAEQTLTLEPADCFGAIWSFTEGEIPNDPRGPSIMEV